MPDQLPVLGRRRFLQAGPASRTEPITRRDLLRRAGTVGAATAGAILLPGALPAGPGALAADSPFRHGVASGDPYAHSVVLWTRVDPSAPDATVPVTWVVARDIELIDVVARGTVTATGRRDHTVKVVAEGLAPYTYYYYGFRTGRHASLTGRTRTAPAPGQAVDRLRFGVTSCANLEGGRVFNAYRLMARRDLDAVFALGDYYYEYGADDLEPTVEITTLDDYRTRHAFYKRNPDLMRAHQLFPWITVWDDHESANNSWFGGANNHSRDGSDPNDRPNGPDDPVDEGPWDQRKAWAQQAYEEWMPVRTTDPSRIWRQLAYGDLVDVIMLDTRLDGRSEQVPSTIDGEGGELVTVDAAVNDPDRAMISDEQRDFLFDALESSTATWKLLGNQVLMSQLRVAHLPETISQQLLLPPTGDEPTLMFVQSGGAVLATDIWDGYNAERERLFTRVRDAGIENVVVMTGDIHTSWANDLYSDPFLDQTQAQSGLADLHVGVEFVTPGITSSGFPSEQARALEPLIPAQNPGTKFVNLDRNGYMVLDVTADRVQADWWWVATVTERSDVEGHGASWFTAVGANPVQEAVAPSDDRPDRPAAPPAEAPAGSHPPASTPVPATPDAPDRGRPLPATGGGTITAAAAVLAVGTALRLRRRQP